MDKPSSYDHVLSYLWSRNRLLYDYFRDHRDQWENDSIRACYAWTTSWRDMYDGHDFIGWPGDVANRVENEEADMRYRAEECRWCGRSRQQIRYGDNLELLFSQIPSDRPHCFKVPTDTYLSIYDVVAKESAHTYEWLDRAEHTLAFYRDKPLTGADLSYIHQTFGYSSDIVADVLGISIGEDILSQYNEEYDKHRESGKRGRRDVVLVAKTL